MDDNLGQQKVQITKYGDAFQETQEVSQSPLLLADRLRQGDPENGRKLFRRCAICHTSEKSGGDRVGPALWEVVGRPLAARKTFPYSQALRKNFDKNWDFSLLDRYLKSPRRAIPGTTMSFRGIENDQDRADLLLYLRNLSDHPVPLP
ncbi:membrane c-type cytochrome cy [Bartonella ancashensis]|uniref:Membrane c-type cytochrome cy n=2 Tax=Bartonella ancashensis TaxID=1318743 RepID=A0A0M4LJE2_9HYPH|nr:membrane c-type cytochrome cy [Bartonella ancashensis]